MRQNGATRLCRVGGTPKLREFVLPTPCRPCARVRSHARRDAQTHVSLKKLGKQSTLYQRQRTHGTRAHQPTHPLHLKTNPFRGPWLVFAHTLFRKKKKRINAVVRSNSFTHLVRLHDGRLQARVGRFLSLQLHLRLPMVGLGRLQRRPRLGRLLARCGRLFQHGSQVQLRLQRGIFAEETREKILKEGQDRDSEN